MEAADAGRVPAAAAAIEAEQAIAQRRFRSLLHHRLV
jgi:hypothetical protein